MEKLFQSKGVTRLLAGWFSRGAVDEVRRLVSLLTDMIEGYRSAREFERDWKWIRLVVPLQVRLLVEQILWDKRGGWRDLVTGFGPVKGRYGTRSKLDSGRPAKGRA